MSSRKIPVSLAVCCLLLACTHFDADAEPDSDASTTTSSGSTVMTGSTMSADAGSEVSPGSGAGGGTNNSPGKPPLPNDPSCLPSPEQCDNRDNDCDGRVDEDLRRDCGPMAVGQCKPGAETCSAGTWGACVGAIMPATEACDAAELDENCNGVRNEGCTCAASATKECGKNEGVCRAGTQSCVNGQWATECVGGAGKMGQGCQCTEGMSTSCMEGGMGVCAPGTKQCSNGMWGACKPTTPASTEVCDNLDNDCDGTIDGQRATCPQGKKCITGGRCVACTGNADCVLLSSTCADGVCENDACVAKPKPENTPCSSLFTSGICVSSACTAPKKITIEDTNVGSGDGQVNYSGTWQTTGAVHFNDGTTTSAYYLVKFTGLKIAIYGGKYPDRGYAAYSVCNASGTGCGSEARISNYDPAMRDYQLLWQSGDLTYGQHTVKVRTTNASESQTGKIVDFDYAIVN